jgi:TPR repeat protein
MAADDGDIRDKWRYAEQLLKGDGMEQNLAEARKYFKLASDGEPSSSDRATYQWQYAEMLMKGDIIGQDIIEARSYFSKAADEGAKFHGQLPWRYAEMLARGVAVDQDLDAAEQYFKKAADRGDPSMRWRYAEMLAKKGASEAQGYFGSATCPSDSPFKMRYADRFPAEYYPN